MFGFIKKIFNFFAAANKKLLQVEDILPEALNVARVIASLTPTRSDEEILNLINRYAHGSVKVTDFASKGDAMRAVARIMLQQKLRKNIRESILNAAIDLAALEFNGD